MIIEKTIELFEQKYPGRIASLTISKVVIGMHLTAVRLSDGSAGVASTVAGNHQHCDKNNRDFGIFTPAQIEGHSVAALLQSKKESPIIDSLRVAVLNALSSLVLGKGHYRIIDDADPIDLIDLSGSRHITLVGAFQSYISRIAATGNHLKVLELNPQAFTEEQRSYYVPATDFAFVLPHSDIVIITGLALVNNTMASLLGSISKGATVAVAGPSGSLLPDILFENNVKIIGATRITDTRKLFAVAGQGGAGYHLFRYCAQKICIVND